jgi:O-antigen/teichoic acid export membrane protein
MLLPQLAQLQKQGGVAAADRFMWQTTAWLTAVMAMFFAVVVLTSSWLVPAVYGSQYVGTQHPLVVLTLAQVISGASLPAARALFVMQRPDQVFKSHLVGIIVNVALGIPMVHWWGVAGAAYATLLGATLKALLGGAWYFSHVQPQLSDSGRSEAGGAVIARVARAAALSSRGRKPALPVTTLAEEVP